MDEYTFLVEHKFPSFNEVINASKRHWAAYAKIKKESTELVERYAKDLKRVFKVSEFQHVSITLTWFEKEKGRKRDWDNITFAKKFILDGLVNAGWIPDDSPKYIDRITEQVVYSDAYGVRIEIDGVQ